MSGEKRSGTNSGSMTLAMNSTVISGTPRTNSMKVAENNRTTGSSERRPNASKMPSGNDATMPTVASRIVTRMPPHRSVEMRGGPNEWKPAQQSV